MKTITNLKKLRSEYDNLLLNGTSKNPVDIYEKIQILQLMIEELKVKYPKEVFKAYVNSKKTRGLI